MAKARKAYGFEVRKPFASERKFFRENRHIAGMATADNRITMNPFSPLKPGERQAVVKNEAARLLMRKKRQPFSFSLTPQQVRSFAGTTYGQPGKERARQETVVGRLVSKDPSAGESTEAQRLAASRVSAKLERRQRQSRSAR